MVLNTMLDDLIEIRFQIGLLLFIKNILIRVNRLYRVKLADFPVPIAVKFLNNNIFDPDTLRPVALEYLNTLFRTIDLMVLAPPPVLGGPELLEHFSRSFRVLVEFPGDLRFVRVPPEAEGPTPVFEGALIAVGAGGKLIFADALIPFELLLGRLEIVDQGHMEEK
jgi:hypothetical protein